MEGVEDELRKRPCVFDLLSEAFRKPLYPGCKKFTKLIAVLTIFDIKLMFNSSDTIFTMLLVALDKMLPDGNDLSKSTYYTKKLICFLLA